MEQDRIKSLQRIVALNMLNRLQDRAMAAHKLREYKMLWHCWNIIFWEGVSRTSQLQHEKWLEEMKNG